MGNQDVSVSDPAVQLRRSQTGPPDHAQPTVPDLGANQEGARTDQFLSVRSLSHVAFRVNRELQLGISGARLRVLIKRFTESRHTTSGELKQALLADADPTGERAVRTRVEAPPATRRR